MLSNSKVVNTCKDKKKRLIELVLKKHLEKFDIKPNRVVLNVLNLIIKGRIFNNWNGEQFASLYQIMDVFEIK